MTTTINFFELAKAKLKEWQENPTKTSFYQARDFLQASMDRLIAAPRQPAQFDDTKKLPPLTQDELAGLALFTPFIEMNIKARCEIFYGTASGYVRLLRHPQGIDYITNTPGGERALAHFACYLGLSYVYDKTIYTDNERSTQESMRRILEKLTSKGVPGTGPVDAKTAVACLYGPTCWDLYDLTKPGEADMVLLRQTLDAITDAGLPLVYKKNRSRRRRYD